MTSATYRLGRCAVRPRGRVRTSVRKAGVPFEPTRTTHRRRRRQRQPARHGAMAGQRRWAGGWTCCRCRCSTNCMRRWWRRHYRPHAVAARTPARCPLRARLARATMPASRGVPCRSGEGLSRGDRLPAEPPPRPVMMWNCESPVPNGLLPMLFDRYLGLPSGLGRNRRRRRGAKRQRRLRPAGAAPVRKGAGVCVGFRPLKDHLQTGRDDRHADRRTIHAGQHRTGQGVFELAQPPRSTRWHPPHCCSTLPCQKRALQPAMWRSTPTCRPVAQLAAARRPVRASDPRRCGGGTLVARMSPVADKMLDNLFRRDVCIARGFLVAGVRAAPSAAFAAGTPAKSSPARGRPRHTCRACVARR